MHVQGKAPQWFNMSSFKVICSLTHNKSFMFTVITRLLFSNRNLLSLDSQSEEWFIKRSHVYQTFIEVSAKSFTYSGEMYGFKWSVCLQLPLEYQYFQLNPEKQEVLLQPQIVCLVMELLTEMLIKFDVSPHFLRNKKLMWMSSCRLHPVLCVINFYDNNQDRKGAFFLLPANINISLCREDGKMGLDRDLLYF